MIGKARALRNTIPRFSSFFRHNSPLFCLIILLQFLLIGCGSSSHKSVTIKLWEYPRWRENEQAIDRFYWMKRQIVEFERLYPGVSIQLTELTWEHGEDKKKIAVTAGVGPDIITGTLPVQLVDAGLIEPIDGYLPPQEKMDFLAPALESFTYDGKLYGWPWYVTGSVLFANLDLIKESGASAPEDGWTQTEFLDFIRRLTNTTNAGRSSYGFAFLINPGDTSVWPFLFPAGINFSGDGGGAQALASGINSDFLYRLVHTYHVAPPYCAAWDAETLWQHFTAQRDVALIPCGIWAIPRLRALQDFDFDALAFPSFAEDGEAAPAFIGTSGFMTLRQNDPEKRRLCMEFCKFLVRPEAQADLLKYGVMPSRKSAGDIYHDDPLMSKVQRIFSLGQAVPRHAKWAQIDEKFQRELQLALLGQKAVSAAFSESHEQIKALLNSSPKPASGASAKSSFGWIMYGAVAAAVLGGAFFVLIAGKKTPQSVSAYAFIAPATLVFAVFLLFPLCWVLFLTFQDYTFAQARPDWVGLQNLKNALSDPVFRRSAANTFVYAAVVVPANVLSALVVASLIYPLSNKARAFFRGAYYLPGVASVVVITMSWRWMFNENFGILNAAFGFFGVPPVRWLTDTRIALWSVILTSIARPPGGPVLIYLAALDAIPKSLYDAGELDGAGALRKWWHITIPLLRPTTLFLVLTITIASFQVFTQVFILTDGGPGYATEVVAHRIYTAAIRDFDFGAAAAMSLLLFGVIMLASIVQYRFFNSKVEY